MQAREKAANTQDAKKARAERKKADALKKKSASKKLGKAGKAGSADEEEDTGTDEWMCASIAIP